MKKLLQVVIIMSIIVSSFATNACNKKVASSRIIPIPKREHGYSNFESTVIKSQDELNTFLNETSKKESGWNNREDFDKAIAQGKTDFSREVLLLLRHTEGSGSVQVNYRESQLIKDKLVLEIDRQAPQMGTADMAYYCFALAISKKDVSQVELKISGKKPVIISLR